MADEYLSTAELAAEFHAPPGTVRFWRMTGTGPRGTRFGKRVLYRRSDIEAWAAAKVAAEHGAA